MKAKQCSYDGCDYIGPLWQSIPRLCKTHALMLKAKENPPSYASTTTDKKAEKVYSTTRSSDYKRPSQKDFNSLDDKSIQELGKLAVIVFNAWIKKRDRNGTYFRCISCGEVKSVAVMQCGHFMPSTYTSLKLDEYNANGECDQCNCHDPNHLIGYRKNLIKKVGFDKVLELEQTPLALYFKWERSELYEIINKYK